MLKIMEESVRSSITAVSLPGFIHEEGHPVWQKDYELFVGNVGFETKLCKSRHPFTKGAVEMRIRPSVSENLEMDELLKRHPLDQELLKGIYDLIVETLLGKSENLVISGSRYPADFVKNKLWKLRMDHVEYVLKCLKENTTKVRNVRKYMLASLFNAPTTIDGYYQSEVNHDLAWGTTNIS